MNILDIKPVTCPLCGGEMPCKFVTMHEHSGGVKAFKIMYRCSGDKRHVLWGDCGMDELKGRLKDEQGSET